MNLALVPLHDVSLAFCPPVFVSLLNDSSALEYSPFNGSTRLVSSEKDPNSIRWIFPIEFTT